MHFISCDDPDEVCNVLSMDTEHDWFSFDNGRDCCRTSSLVSLTRRNDDTIFAGLDLDVVVDISGQDSDLSNSFLTKCLIYQYFGIECCRHNLFSRIFWEIPLDQ